MFPKFIDLKKLPDPIEEYVAWIDIMGTKSVFEKTDKSPTLYILKLHACAESVIKGTDFNYYPAVDGFFLTHKECNVLLVAVKNIFQQVAQGMINERNIEYRFMIRAGLSYGSVTHGKNINIDDPKLSDKLKKSLLFGKAVVAATEAEKGAPPFSINIDETSVDHFTPSLSNGLTRVNNHIIWFDIDFVDKDNFKKSIIEYYTWINKKPMWSNYDPEKMKKHLFEFLMMFDT